MPKAIWAGSLIVLILWWFPKYWYSAAGDRGDYVWFGEQQNIAGWQYEEVPISESAERVIDADKMFNGTFINESGQVVRVYSAKRYVEKSNEIGLFNHTPDRCWIAAGWKIVPENPQFIERNVHGVPMLLERRIFRAGTRRELVYFGALVGGKPLPYRLDQYLSAGLRRDSGERGDNAGTMDRISQGRVWSWAWDSFIERTPLAGPQQLIRISTTLQGGEKAADELLSSFLEKWLKPVNYREERAVVLKRD